LWIAVTVALALLAGCAGVPDAAKPPNARLTAKANVQVGGVFPSRSDGEGRYEKTARDARELIDGRKLDEAEKLLSDAVGSIDVSEVPHLPLVEDGVLYAYGTMTEQWVPPETDWSIPRILATLPAEEAARLEAGLPKRVKELYAATPWTRVVYVRPSVPEIYQRLGYIADEWGDYQKAADWLDVAPAL